MKRRPPTALLAAGNVTASSVLRSASVRESLGPVKAASLRVASRVVNLLRAGHAVEDFEEINECKVILAVAPRERTGALLEELRGSGMKLKNKYIVICGDGALPDPAGMRVARVREAAGFEGRWYVMDGNREAAADLRRILGPGVRLTILEGDATPLWDAAQALLERGLIAVSAAADDCLRRPSTALFARGCGASGAWRCRRSMTWTRR